MNTYIKILLFFLLLLQGKTAFLLAQQNSHRFLFPSSHDMGGIWKERIHYQNRVKDGLALEDYQWKEGQHHFLVFLGKETHIGSYINGLREGRWLIFHDSSLFADVNYVHGLAEGEAIYHIYNEFFIWEYSPHGTLEWKPKRISPVKDSLILKINYHDGNLEGDYILYSLQNEILLWLQCKDEKITAILQENKLYPLNIEESPPFKSVWGEEIIKEHINVINLFRSIYKE